MKLVPTTLLKSVIALIGIVVLAICLLALPSGIKSELSGDFDYGWIFIGMYVSAIPFFIALFQANKLLDYIDKNQVFTNRAVNTLRNIKACAYIISIMFVTAMPYIFYLGDKDDAPGVVALGLVIIFASFIIGTCAALFQKLLQNAVAIKSENDLTV